MKLFLFHLLTLLPLALTTPPNLTKRDTTCIIKFCIDLNLGDPCTDVIETSTSPDECLALPPGPGTFLKSAIVKGTSESKEIPIWTDATCGASGGTRTLLSVFFPVGFFGDGVFQL
ncbi:hypothetical protein L873DRAFT_1804771 [Choiromyces venosus 120613-1]|uniref:Uncharacterized protein n=1 Tax=Choiromyces venosus 120613-1 TaxID=1336337 RepID=A0A3N4JR74_9PEZI|nr:hypothetical protein L873DRAFT_1804771 [Choiromyces venosus 120613-1]